MINENGHNTTYWNISECDSVETTNKMQPCNRIYYSTGQPLQYHKLNKPSQ